MCLLNKINRVYQSQISGSLRVYVCVLNGSVPWVCVCVWVTYGCAASAASLLFLPSLLVLHLIILIFKIINNCLLKQSFVQLLSMFSFDFRFWFCFPCVRYFYLVLKGQTKEKKWNEKMKTTKKMIKHNFAVGLEIFRVSGYSVQ